MTKKKFIWMAVFLIITGLSLWAVTSNKNFSLSELYDDIANAKKGWFLLGILCMLGNIIFEGISISCVIKALSPEKYRGHGILYSASEIYFSAITPSASGGQPASMYFMIRDGISGSVAMIALLLNLIMYTLSLMISGIVCIAFRFSLLTQYSSFAKLLISVGYIVLTGLLVGIFLLLFHESLFSKIANAVFSFLIKIKLIKNVEKRKGKLDYLIQEYKECSVAIVGQKKMLIKVFLFNIMQRFSQISVTMLMFLAVGGSYSKAFDVWSVQGLTLVGSNCIPIPGAVGAADYLLIEGFSHIAEIESTANLELLCRGISFYSCMLLSGIIVLIGYFWKREKK